MRVFSNVTNQFVTVARKGFYPKASTASRLSKALCRVLGSDTPLDLAYSFDRLVGRVVSEKSDLEWISLANEGAFVPSVVENVWSRNDEAVLTNLLNWWIGATVDGLCYDTQKVFVAVGLNSGRSLVIMDRDNTCPPENV